MRFGAQIIAMTIELAHPSEVRFTTSGQMVCRIYGKDLDGVVFTLWVEDEADEESVGKLIDVKVGSRVTVKGTAKTKVFRDRDGGEQSYRAFTVLEWKEV